MRELKLKYFIDLVSNIREKAGSDAHALAQAQGKIQSELDKTSTKLGNFERVLLRVGNMHGAGMERQAQYFSRIAMDAARAQAAVEKLGRGIGTVNKGLQAVTGAGAGLAGAGYVVKSALDKPMDYDTRLRAVTQTTYAGAKTLAELESGYVNLNALINGTVRGIRGAKRDDTLGAYEGLVGTGAFSREESAKLLPTVMKAAVASRSDPLDLVKSAEKMKMNFGLTPEQIEVALAKVMRAGQEGGFEIKDSSKWIGPLANLFKDYHGMAAVEAMVTMLQQVRSTAGTNDEAANNLRNFMQKMPADSTRKDFAKQGIDLDAEMAKGAVRGKTPVDTYMALLDRVMAKQDPQGKAREAMKGADKSLTPEERAQRYGDVAKIYEKAGISKIINDLQEMGGYTGLAGTRDYGAKVLANVKGESGDTVKLGYDFMAAGSGARAVDVANRKDIAGSDALAGMAAPLNAMLDKVIGLTDQFPKTTAVAYTAATALAALAAASAAASMLGGAGVGAKVGGVLGRGAGWLGGLYGAQKLGRAAATGLTLGGVALPAAGLALAGGAGYGLGTGVHALLEGTDFDNSLGRLLARGAAVLGNENAAQALALERGSAPHALQSMAGSGRAFGTPMGVPPALDFLTLTAPGATPTSLAPGKSTDIKLGEGRLAIDVRVSDERVSASSSVLQPMSAIRINAGSTNPGGFK